MIRGKDIFEVIGAIIPLYVALLLGFSSVRFFKIFSPDQCSGINRFVAVFAVPLLSFHFISTNNPYSMNYHFLAADTLQKIAVISSLALYHILISPLPTSLDWTITLFSLSTLPNTLVIGIPLLRAMYGDFSASLMVQIVVLQSLLWYTLMLFFFEYRAAKSLIAHQFPPEVTASISSFRVDSDVLSLAAAPLHAEADVAPDGRLRVVVRRDRDRNINSSNNNCSSSSSSKSVVMTPRASNLTGVEIYSLQSSREPTPRGSSFNQLDSHSMQGSAGSGLDEEVGVRFGRKSGDLFSNFGGNKNWRNNVGSSKELHMYVWSASSASPASEANLRNAVNRAASSTDFGALDQSSNSANLIPLPDFPSSTGLPLPGENASPTIRKGEQIEIIEDGLLSKLSPAGVKFPANNGSPFLGKKKLGNEGGGLQKVEGNNQQMPPTTVMTRLILIMVWRKLIRNPNTYSSLIGLVWSLVSFRWNIEMPAIIKGSIAILSDAGLGMAMFSLGLFMALQPKIIACGKSVAAFSMAVRFLTGPAVIAATSIAIGVRGVLLHVAIVQAALPQGIVPFVFAKEYNCHPDILSTAVIFGMLIALPITILYYVLLGV